MSVIIPRVVKIALEDSSEEVGAAATAAKEEAKLMEVVHITKSLAEKFGGLPHTPSDDEQKVYVTVNMKAFTDKVSLVRGGAVITVKKKYEVDGFPLELRAMAVVRKLGEMAEAFFDASGGVGAHVHCFSRGCCVVMGAYARETLKHLVRNGWITTITVAGVGFQSKEEWENLVAFLNGLRDVNAAVKCAVIVFHGDRHEKANAEIRGAKGVILKSFECHDQVAAFGADMMQTLPSGVPSWVPTYYVEGVHDAEALAEDDFGALLTSHSNCGELFVEGSNFMLGGAGSWSPDHPVTKAWLAAQELSVSRRREAWSDLKRTFDALFGASEDSSLDDDDDDEISSPLPAVPVPAMPAPMLQRTRTLRSALRSPSGSAMTLRSATKPKKPKKRAKRRR